MNHNILNQPISFRPRVDYTQNPETDDPMVMYIVVNTANAPTEETVVKAVAKALYGLFNDSDNHKSILAWCEGRIRKIVKRANSSQWGKLIAPSNPMRWVLGEHRDTRVLVFVPVLMSETIPVIRKLQVSGLVLPTVPSEVSTTVDRELVLTVNEVINLSSGKLVAQVAHGIQLFLMLSPVSVVREWADKDCPLAVSRGRVIDEDLVVLDAGLTEIPHGTATVAVSY